MRLLHAVLLTGLLVAAAEPDALALTDGHHARKLQSNDCMPRDSFTPIGFDVRAAANQT